VESVRAITVDFGSSDYLVVQPVQVNAIGGSILYSARRASRARVGATVGGGVPRRFEADIPEVQSHPASNFDTTRTTMCSAWVGS